MCRVNNPASGLPDISIRQLEYLVAVAEAPTWAAAADRVGVSASALSQGLAELERRVGVELFESVGRRRILRATVTPVLEHARQVLALTRDVCTWAERLRTAQSGRVRLGMIVDTTSLLSEPMIVYGPPDSTIGAPSSWGPWVLFPSDSHTRRLVVERLSALGAPVTVAAESHQPDVLREMVLLGLGWTVLPRSQGESERGAMTVGDQILERKLVLARRAGVVTDPAVDELAHRLQTRPTAD